MAPLRNIKILTKMQKKKYEILIQTDFVMGRFWTIQKITLKFALLSLTILYIKDIVSDMPDAIS